MIYYTTDELEAIVSGIQWQIDNEGYADEELLNELDYFDNLLQERKQDGWPF